VVEFILASLHHPANGSKVWEPPLIGVREVVACNIVRRLLRPNPKPIKRQRFWRQPRREARRFLYLLHSLAL